MIRNLTLAVMRFTLFLFLFISSGSAFAQTGYRIQFKIEGLKDTTAYLAYFINESTFVKDTAKVNGTGELVFSGTEKLLQGVYTLVLNKTRQFEFLVGNNQRFTLETTMEDYVLNMKVSGDQDNELFFENILFRIARSKEAEPFLKVASDSSINENAKKEARSALSGINDQVMAYQDDVINKHPETLTARLLKSGKPVMVPDPPKKTDGSIDSTFQLKWYRAHFFDNFDLADDALLHLPRPAYRDKLYEYLDKLYAQHADTITKAVNNIIAKAKINKETYKYAVFLCALKYQNHEIMGLDEVYVNLYDQYFATGEMDFWANAGVKKNFKDQADRFRKSLVGKTGANLIMQDANLKPRALYDIKNKYTVLYIFDPDCGSCKKETPKLLTFYKSKKFDVEVFAVSTDTSLSKMKNYIKELDLKWITVNGPRTYVGPYQDLYDAMSTPTLYVLDRKKKIIGKKIPAEKLEEFLTHFEKLPEL
jgi:thiol-disulfide isomerase/thioredoxin